MSFAEKYDGTPFDESDPFDRCAEHARRAVTNAWIDRVDLMEEAEGRQLEAVGAGALVGLVGCMACHMVESDEAWASLRSGLIQLIPWAVDMTRDMHGLPPLSDDCQPVAANAEMEGGE